MAGNTCLITGCALFAIQYGYWIWGDLHQVGDCYVFNATGCNPEYNANLSKEVKSITVRGEFFFKNSIYVFSKVNAALNEEAKQYIGER